MNSGRIETVRYPDSARRQIMPLFEWRTIVQRAGLL